MKDFLRTWSDWWFFIPISFALAIGSYWFVPAILKSCGMPEQDMSYTGTAWIYDLFKTGIIFMFGVGIVSLAFRWFFPSVHNYLESGQWDMDVQSSPDFKLKISLLIPAIMFICYCLICLAAFK